MLPLATSFHSKHKENKTQTHATGGSTQHSVVEDRGTPVVLVRRDFIPVCIKGYTI